MLHRSIIILSAVALDSLVGDPSRLPHPVRCIGRMVAAGESALLRVARTPRMRKLAGAALALAVPVLVYAAVALVLSAAERLFPLAGAVLSILAAYTSIAARGLADAARAVLQKLNLQDIAGARQALAMIVGRDTDSLAEPEIIRATVETVAENTSDGVIAPLFYLALGGPALALAYKAVNTMDSMIGYRNERYRDFGWAAARLDDVANFLPARLAAALLCCAASVLLGRGREAARTAISDGRNHPSPNSGYPEAAMAGALGLRFGGPCSYGGVPGAKPYIGRPVHGFEKKNIAMSVRLMYVSTLFAALAAAAVAV